MILFKNTLLIVVRLIIGLSFLVVYPQQSKEQKALEAQRDRLKREIAEMNRLLRSEKKQRGNVVEQMETLDKKINVNQQLIRVTNRQSNLLNRQINSNIRNVSKLREDLKILKEDYAGLIQKSYQNKNQQSRLMFLLSAESFQQAFKRMRYMNQYTKYRKKQGEEIIAKTEEIGRLNNDLISQRKEKDQLVAENTATKADLAAELETQKDLLRAIKSNEQKYAAAIKSKQKEARRIDREIDRLIKQAIASSNRKSGSSGSSKFVLTPEAKLVATNFSASKGKLIWPVDKGYKSQGFGVYADKVYPGIKHQNNGVTIATDKGAQARSIFEGEVMTILSSRSGAKGVYVRHGDYISLYYNLSRVYVEKGDKVTAKTILGDILTNAFDGKTKLKFYLFKNTTRLNPEDWVYQL